MIEYDAKCRALTLTALLGVRLHFFSGASTFIKHAHAKKCALRL